MADEPEQSNRLPLTDISFSHELIFVRPDRRGAGFGRYLSLGAVTWLQQCRVRPPRCSEAGVNVLYHADSDSRGGAVCSEIVTNYFECLRDLRRDVLPDELPWLISTFTENTGF